ncbi:MAG: sigma-70 family RNA polymerase sigma factor, partial [Clostridia bacterium]|nr:sigma-70 family RNA polymerase sigma factor [Clostridia bacterium]
MIALAMAALPPDELERFHLLLATWSGMMHREIKKILSQPQDQEDAMQEATLRLLRFLPKIGDPTERPSGNLCYIAARHAAFDLLRTRPQEVAIGFFEDELMQEDPLTGERVSGFFEALSFEEALADFSALAGCITELTERERHVLHLRYELQYTQREAAKLLGVTPSAVSRTETRAL